MAKNNNSRSVGSKVYPNVKRSSTKRNTRARSKWYRPVPKNIIHRAMRSLFAPKVWSWISSAYQKAKAMRDSAMS
jgi:hypothetical protein